MSNFFQDNQDMQFHLDHMDLRKIVELKEDSFKEANQHLDAPKNHEDALDNYKRLLEIVGDISGEFIAPRAPQVDAEGASYKDGRVKYAKGTAEALHRLKQSELMGMTLPRRYGGLNMPKIIYSMAIEMISRADASLMNLFGLQDIADTIYKFSTEEQRLKYLPRFSSGEVMGSMALTEPDAGSDLQAAMLKASQDEDGTWRLNGVKRFITNGCAQISLVMARSEEGSTDGRGLSLFVYERDENMKIRRIEHKLGITASPTCELQFNNAPSELLGRRRFGLIKYTMYLMNGARLGIAAQALGIAEAAFREANKYSKERNQFKKPIRDFTAVYEMLTDMQVAIEAGRSLLYETSRIVDIKEESEELIEKEPDRKDELGPEIKKYTRYASLYTPLVKAYNTEMANKVCYDAIQIHGGVGFTTEFNVERHYRDVRITNIYEGTTQLQVVAAIGGVTSGIIFERLDEYEKEHNLMPLGDLFDTTKSFRASLEKAVTHIKDQYDTTVTEFHARRLIEMTIDTVNSYLLLIDALNSDRKKKVAQIYISKAKHRINANLGFIEDNDYSIVEFRNKIIGT